MFFREGLHLLNTPKVSLRFRKPVTRGQPCGDQAGRGTKSPPYAHRTHWQETLLGNRSADPRADPRPLVLLAGGGRSSRPQDVAPRPRPCSSPGPWRPLANAAPPHSAPLRCGTAEQKGACARVAPPFPLAPLPKCANRRVRVPSSFPWRMRTPRLWSPPEGAGEGYVAAGTGGAGGGAGVR